jgi:predicted lysophospholipase L1 biosynthesis ABC-type transport system permease subunit
MLVVARNVVHEREFALRRALGAGRWPLLRMLLAESGILVAAGSLLGWLFAFQTTRPLASWSQLEISLAPDTTVLLFTLAISAIAAVLFSLAPLRTVARPQVGLVLKSSGTQVTATRSHIASGKILIALQMAFCVVLLFAASLLLRNYKNVDLGMQAKSVLGFGVHPLGAHEYAQSLAFYTQPPQNASRRQVR